MYVLRCCYVSAQKRAASQKQGLLPSSVGFADSFPPRGSLGLLQTRQNGAHPCLPLWGRCPSAAKDGEGQQRPYRPSQSASLTALPKGEPRDFRKSLLPQKTAGHFFTIHYYLLPQRTSLLRYDEIRISAQKPGGLPPGLSFISAALSSPPPAWRSLPALAAWSLRGWRSRI